MNDRVARAPPQVENEDAKEKTNAELKFLRESVANLTKAVTCMYMALDDPTKLRAHIATCEEKTRDALKDCIRRNESILNMFKPDDFVEKTGLTHAAFLAWTNEARTRLEETDAQRAKNADGIQVMLPGLEAATTHCIARPAMS